MFVCLYWESFQTEQYVLDKKGFEPMQKFSKSKLGSSLIAVGGKVKLQLCVLFPPKPQVPRRPIWVSRTTIANVLHHPTPVKIAI